MSRIPIPDPRLVPVISLDEHLSPVPAERLTAAALRERFAHPPQWTAEITGDGRMFDREPAHAAVLVPLVDHGDTVSVLLTRRTDHLRDHAGQISFPGGRVEERDVDAVDTALRETEEEVGLPRSHIEVIGTLSTYVTVTAFHVTPVVALVRPGYTLALDPFEVAEAFEVPLAFLMTPAHHQRHRFEAMGQSREFLSMPWNEHFVWGATAAMLRNLYRFLIA